MNFVITVLVWLGVIPKSIVPLLPAIEKAIPETIDLIDVIAKVVEATNGKPEAQKNVVNNITKLVGNSFEELQKEHPVWETYPDNANA